MWKILCFIVVCHLTLSSAQIYTQHVKLTKFDVKPNNELLVYDAAADTVMFLTHFGVEPLNFRYNYYFQHEDGDAGSGGGVVRASIYWEMNREDKRLYVSMLRILIGFRSSALKGYTFKINRNTSFGFTDNTDGLLIECSKATAEVTVIPRTKNDAVFTMEFDYYLTGPKCNSKQ